MIKSKGKYQLLPFNFHFPKVLRKNNMILIKRNTPPIVVNVTMASKETDTFAKTSKSAPLRTTHAEKIRCVSKNTADIGRVGKK